MTEASYTIVWEWAAWKQFEPLGSEAHKRILSAIDGLASDRHPASATAIVGQHGSFRIRSDTTASFIVSMTPAKKY
jgi:hypothetical protein